MDTVYDQPKPAPQTTLRDALASPETRMQWLTKILRASGAAVVVAAAATFLFQHWEKGNDLTRYYTLLAQSGLLSAIGFFCAVRIRESKGARTFMALAAGIVPALFCILGGLVYSQFAIGGAVGEVARYAKWVAPEPETALLTVGVSLLVVAPICFLSMLSLVRPMARSLTAVFLAANAALLLPSRTPETMAVVFAVLLVTVGLFEWKRWRHEPSMRTGEGWIVRAMVASPMALLVLRSLLHYEFSLFMTAAASLAVSTLFFLSARGFAKGRSSELCESAAVVFSVVGWGSFGVAMHESFTLHAATFLPFIAFPLAATFLGVSLLGEKRGTTYRNGAVVVALAGVAGNLLFAPSVLSSFLALAIGILGAAYGFFFARQALLVAGAAAAIGGLTSHVAQAIHLYGHWTSLSVLGIAVILGASLLERHHRALGDRLRALQERVRRYDPA